MTSALAVLRAAVFLSLLVIAPAQALQPLPGWEIRETPHDYPTLVTRVEAAIEASPLALVTRASATVGARAIGREIPGNMVIGVFAPPFAVRMLEASVQAGIEAPLRLYVTENEDGTATLSWRTASHVFAPYDDGGSALDELAVELDGLLLAIGRAAID
ncbi:MAG: DUF302 domain-containing protein [Pseudomonadota bacterium]